MYVCVCKCVCVCENQGNHGNHGIGGKEVVPSDQWDHLRSNACCNLNMHPLLPW